MKTTTLLIFFCFFCGFVNSQDIKPLNVRPISPTYYGPDGFWGLKFGESRKDVIRDIKVRNFDAEIHINKTDLNTDVIIVDDVSFAGNPCRIVLMLYKDKLINAVAQIPVDHCVDALDKYNDVKNDLMKKYGDPKLDQERYYPPYEKGDGYFATGVQAGKIKISCTWGFYEDKDLTKAIRLMVDDNCIINLTYLDEKLGKNWQKTNKSQDMKDY